MSPVSAGLAVLLLLPALTAAQAPDPGQTFSGTVEVREAEVEVLVTDRDGRPVPGLTAEDFRVLEDGQPVEVTHVSPMSSQPLVLAVFLDDTSLAGSSRSLVLSGLRRFLASGLRSGDRLLLIRYDGSLEIQGEPTGDLAALEAALDRIGKTAARGSLLAHERSSLQQDILQALPPVGDSRDIEMALAQANVLKDGLRRYGQLRSDAVRASLAALQQALAILSSLAERKALLYIGGGLPMSPGADLMDLWMNKYGQFASQLDISPLETLSWDASRLVQETADRANAAGIILHALALPEGGGNVASAAGAIGARSGWDPEDSNRAIRTLAAATGGRVVAEIANPAPFLEAAARDLGSAYVVGYTPAGTGGKKGRHKIEVAVRGGALAVRHREERFDGRALDPLLRRALAALWVGGESNPLRAELSIEEQTREEDGRFRVTAILAFPLASVLLQPQEHFHVGHLTLAVAVRDGKGRISGVPRAEVPVEIPNQRLLSAPGQSAGYRFTVHLFPGESVLAIAMRDDRSGTEGVIRTAINPEAAARR
ncbi:MAG TPA: VWA domain-containing protein [Thermoanaerobaculia bacterium]